MHKTMIAMIALAMPVMAQAAPPEPIVPASVSANMADRFMACVETKAVTLGLAHKEVPALDIAHVAATACDNGVPDGKSPAWAVLHSVFEIDADVGPGVGQQLLERRIHDWREAWMTEIAAQVTAKRLGM